MNKTKTQMFASTNFTELWKLITAWIDEEQKTGIVEVANTSTWTTNKIPQHFYAIIFYTKISQ